MSDQLLSQLERSIAICRENRILKAQLKLVEEVNAFLIARLQKELKRDIGLVTPALLRKQI